MAKKTVAVTDITMVYQTVSAWMTTAKGSVEHSNFIQLKVVTTVDSDACYTLLFKLAQLRDNRREDL
jgi:hypothetical protein